MSEEKCNLCRHRIDDISISDGTVLRNPKDMETQIHAYENLGYGELKKGEPWEDVEILSGKVMVPSPDKKKTILFGKCIYQAHKNNPDINEMIAIKGCPPKPESVCEALHKAGIEVDPAIFENLDTVPGFFPKRYEGKPEFDESFYKIN